MSRAAMRRVERAIAGLGPYAPIVTDRGEMLTVADLRAVLALAQKADELRARIRLAREAYVDQPRWRHVRSVRPAQAVAARAGEGAAGGR